MLGTSAHRIFTVAAGGDLTLNNLTLKNGKSGGTTTPESTGGGILCNNAYVTMNNVAVTDCQANYGGGISLWSRGYIKLTGCTIKNNSAESLGGGICIEETSGKEATVELSGHTVIDNNSAGTTSRKDGIYLKGLKSQLIFNNCSISTNAANSSNSQYIWIDSENSVVHGRMTVYGTLTVKNLNGSDTELSVLLVYQYSDQLLFGDITNGTPPNHTKFSVRDLIVPAQPRHFDSSGKVAP